MADVGMCNSQVGDLNIWSLGNPRERFWAARTRQLHSSHMQEGDRLWSNLPFMRPLCGIVEDDCEIKDAGREAKRDERGGVTKWGGRCHDLLGTRCDPYGMFISWKDGCKTLMVVLNGASLAYAHGRFLRLSLPVRAISFLLQLKEDRR